MISNRGMKVWPEGQPETFCSDHWRCRFLPKGGSGTITHQQISGLLARLADAGFDFIKTENLCNFDGQRGYSLDQGA
jgi:isocitrate dehydrogenase